MVFYVCHHDHVVVDPQIALRHALWVVVPHPDEVVRSGTVIIIVVGGQVLSVLVGAETGQTEHFISYKLHHRSPFLPGSFCVAIKPFELCLEAVYLISTMYPM
jgi:hypothetical protein